MRTIHCICLIINKGEENDMGLKYFVGQEGVLSYARSLFQVKEIKKKSKEAVMGFFTLLGYAVWVILTVLIFRKAGYSGLQIVLLFIPVVNIIVFIWFALTEWPIQKELENLKANRQK